MIHPAGFTQLVNIVTRKLGEQIPLEERGEWPIDDGEPFEPEDTAEWLRKGQQLFVHAFDSEGFEMLAVIVNVHPERDFNELIDQLTEVLPLEVEIEVSGEAGSPILVATSYDRWSVIDEEKLAYDFELLLEVADRLALKVAP